MAGDLMPDLSTPLLNALNDRLNNPNIRCDGGSGGEIAQTPVEAQAPVLTSDPTEIPTREPSFPPTKEPTREPIREPTKLPTKTPTKHPTKAPSEQPVDEQPDTINYSEEELDFLYFPYFEGDTAQCRNDHDYKPEYITQNMFSLEGECCETYFLPDVVEECKTSSYTEQLFYPNFEETSCVNDGKQPDWMAGNYLTKNHWLCCHNFFSYNEKLLDECVGELDCADC